MRFVIYSDKRGEWRWRLVARNGRIVADSGEGYASLRGCRGAVSLVAENAGVARIEVVRRG